MDGRLDEGTFRTKPVGGWRFGSTTVRGVLPHSGQEGAHENGGVEGDGGRFRRDAYGSGA